MERKRINAPLSQGDIESLRAGDLVQITGTIYTARDAAHKRLIESLERGENLPFSTEGNIIYYVGPTPAKGNQVIGSAGPTTSGRMDKYTPTLLNLGLKGMIGKGLRTKEVKDSIKQNKAIYFAAVGGAAALISKKITKSEVIAYEDLGTEGIRKLEVVDFPVIVAIDSYGNDYYEQGRNKYLKSLN